MDIESSPKNTEENDLVAIPKLEISEKSEQINMITCSPSQLNIDDESFKNHTVILPEDSCKHTGYSNKAEFRGCGPWGSDCKSCCFFLCHDCCTHIMPCGYLFNKTKSLYFFILYLLTGENDSRANVYKNYFQIEKVDDDNKISTFQIIETIAVVCFELYKTLIGSFLTVFTSQRCGEQTCTIWQNFLPKNDLELAGLISNFLMATSLFIEYIFEIMREAYLIKYLRYDYDIANNGYHISELYESSDKTIFKKLIPLYIIYIRFSYVVLLIYIINVSISAVIIRENYYDNTSLFGFITNALFIIYKIYNVVEITSYKGNYFYSAYKRKNMHYNTIRPQYLLQTHPISFHENSENPSEIPLSFTAQSQLSCDESTITPTDIVEDGNIISSPDIHITIPPETNNAVLSQENTNLTFQEILQSIRKERPANMEEFHEIHKNIIEQSRANKDSDDEDYDEDNNWYIDDAYKRKLKRIQEMKNRRTEH
jgi:hypothetical protein